MAYTWSEFTDAVWELLTVDNDRLGTEDFIPIQIRLAVLDLQRDIPKYRIQHETIYKPSDFATFNQASIGNLPENARIRDAYVLRCKDATITDYNAFAVTVDHVTDTILVGNLEDGGRVKFTAGTIPAGLTAGFWYWIVSAGATSFKVAETIGGTAVAFTTNGLTVKITTATEEGTCDRKPLVHFDWANRYDLIYGLICMDDGLPRISIDAAKDQFLIYPAIVDADDAGYRYTFHLIWDGRKLDFADGEAVPFDEEAVGAVADWVKGEVARHVDNDLQRWASFRELPNPNTGTMGGTYYRQKTHIVLAAQEQSRFQE